MEIPPFSGLKEIENHAFDDQTYTKKVVIADGVEKIGYYAFKGCSNLSSINIPLSLKVIENNAFDGTLYANTAENWTDGVLYLNNWLIDVDDTKTGACTVKEGTVGIIGNLIWKIMLMRAERKLIEEGKEA